MQIGFVRGAAVSKQVHGYLNYTVLLFLHSKIKRWVMQIQKSIEIKVCKL